MIGKGMWTLTAVGILVCAAAAAGAGERARVTTVGQADAALPNAREAAIENALRRAVEAGGGVELASLSETRDFVLIRDVIYTRTAGLVESYDVLEENPDQDGLYTVRVQAVISRGSLDAQIAAWKTLLRRKGHPRVMVVGSVDRRPFETRLTAEIQDTLEQRGMTVIDLDMLTENQRRDAERAARGEMDPLKAALIGQEVGADYFVVVSVEGTQYPAKRVYGITLYEVDATAILKVISVDDARLLASKVVNTRKSDRAQPKATREATTEATQQALRQAVSRVGEHWLEDLDARSGGSQITVVLDRFPFERLNALVKALRADGGVQDVIIDHADAAGRSQLRVMANAPAANVAAALTSADAEITIAGVSKNRIDVALPHPEADEASAEGKMLLAVGLGVVAGVLILLAVWKLAGRKS